MNREEVFTKIYETYCNWYNMEHCGEEKTPLCATGRFHSTDTAYMLTERATMWSADSNDYLYVFDAASFNAEEIGSLIEQAKELGEQLINPQKNHKCSYITALFLCDSADEEAVNALTKYKFRKNFNFGFNGWEEIHTTLFETETGRISSNRDGVNTARFISEMFFPKKKGLLNKLKGV